MDSRAKGDSKLGIKFWSEEDRPREKLLLKGKEALSNAELIAIILGSGTKSLSAVDVAKKILGDNGNDINRISQLSVKELCKFPGIGEAKAIAIVAVAELGRRRITATSQVSTITSSKQAYEYIYAELADLDHERFFIILLSRSNKPLRSVKISSGGLTATVVDPKVVFRKVFDFEPCTGIILAHNHPSGNLAPSAADKKLTEKLCAAGKLLDINVFDHIIVGNNDYYSFSDNNLMPT